MTRFNWDDPLLLESQLTDEERQIRDAAHDYCQENLQPRVLSAFREERFDRETMNEMGELGLLGATVYPEYGGAGVNHVAHLAGAGSGVLLVAILRVLLGKMEAAEKRRSIGA